MGTKKGKNTRIWAEEVFLVKLILTVLVLKNWNIIHIL
jgi:hypothetical protein